VGVLAGHDDLKALLVFTAQLVHSFYRVALQFRMILVFPGARSGFNGLELAQPHQLFFSGLGRNLLRPRLPTMMSIRATNCSGMTM